MPKLEVLPLPRTMQRESFHIADNRTRISAPNNVTSLALPLMLADLTIWKPSLLVPIFT